MKGRVDVFAEERSVMHYVLSNYGLKDEVIDVGGNPGQSANAHLAFGSSPETIKYRKLFDMEFALFLKSDKYREILSKYHMKR